MLREGQRLIHFGTLKLPVVDDRLGRSLIFFLQVILAIINRGPGMNDQVVIAVLDGIDGRTLSDVVAGGDIDSLSEWFITSHNFITIFYSIIVLYN